jgi:hypothetical protein
MRKSTRAAAPKCVCASEHVKLIGAIDGTFPDFGHHLEREMGGLWMHPIKILDGFWLRFRDHDADNVDTWILADHYTCLPEGNVFEYGGGLGHTPVTIRRTQTAPDSVPGVIVVYTFLNRSGEPRKVTAEFAARTDLQPVWLSEKKGIRDGRRDHGAWDERENRFVARDGANPWFAGIRGLPPPDEAVVSQTAGPCPTAGNGVGVSFLYRMTVPAFGETLLTFYLTGSHQSGSECADRLDRLSQPVWTDQKKERIGALLGQSRLTVPDTRFQEAYDWIKVNTDWLTVNAGSYGRGLAAGLPEYPWWFGCDSCYALQGLLAMGCFSLCRDTLRLLARYSEQEHGNGRSPHEVTTFGVCANPGNTQETAHYIVMVWYYYQWTGDAALVRELMPLLGQSVAWLQAQDDDGDGLPGGYGIIEIPGLNAEMIDTAVYTCQAYGCYADFCSLFGQAEDAAAARALYARTAHAIDTLLWDEREGLYCDLFAAPRFVHQWCDALHGHISEEQETFIRSVIDAQRKDDSSYETRECGWLLNRNWTICTPMEAGIAPRGKADRALGLLHASALIGPWGVRLNAFPASHTMTVSTGAMAVAQARYGYAGRALMLLERLASTLGMASPGTVSEISPDGGCFVQAWTAYAMCVPVVRYFFGIQPMAGENTLRLAPAMPAAWPEASLDNVHVTDGAVSLRYTRTEQGYDYRVIYSGHTPVELYVAGGRSVKVGQAVYPMNGKPLTVRMTEREFTAEVTQ